jgi:hypothetical protein
MMSPDYHEPWRLEPAQLMGATWGSCSRMIPSDGSRPVWVVTVWEPQFRGNVFCSIDGPISEVLVIGPPETIPLPEVKSKWYDASGIVPGEIPKDLAPCPLGEAPQADPAAIAAIAPSLPSAPTRKVNHRFSIAAHVEAGPSSALDGFAIGGRIGLGSNGPHSWLGGALQIATWQAAPIFGEWLYQATTIDPALWATWKIDRRGQLRLHGLAGGGLSRYQRRWDDDVEVGWTAGFMGSAAFSYRIISLGATAYGPGFQLCGDRDACDIGMDLQTTLGVLIVR